MVYNIPDGYALTKIRLKTIHSHVQQFLQFALIPSRCVRIGKIHNSHTCLPHIRLPYITVLLFQKISLLHSLLKQGGFLADIGVDPDTYSEPSLMVPLKHPLRVRKCSRIPGEITPFISLHPVTVKMEHMKGNIPVSHSLYKTAGCPLIIIRCKRGGKPEAKRPGRRKCRSSRQFRVQCHRSFGGMPVHDVISKPLAFHGKLYSLHLFTCNFIRGIPLLVKKYSIPLI